ncbi:hypothetical protein [Marinomonas epiphytica]
MNTFKKSAIALFATAVMTSGAFANTDDSPIEQVRTAKAGVDALAKTLELQGVAVDASVNLNGAHTFAEKEAAYQAKYAELQAQFNNLAS